MMNENRSLFVLTLLSMLALLTPLQGITLQDFEKESRAELLETIRNLQNQLESEGLNEQKSTYSYEELDRQLDMIEVLIDSATSGLEAIDASNIGRIDCDDVYHECMLAYYHLSFARKHLNKMNYKIVKFISGDDWSSKIRNFFKDDYDRLRDRIRVKRERVFTYMYGRSIQRLGTGRKTITVEGLGGRLRNAINNFRVLRNWIIENCPDINEEDIPNFTDTGVEDTSSAFPELPPCHEQLGLKRTDYLGYNWMLKKATKKGLSSSKIADCAENACKYAADKYDFFERLSTCLGVERFCDPRLKFGYSDQEMDLKYDELERKGYPDLQEAMQKRCEESATSEVFDKPFPLYTNITDPDGDQDVEERARKDVEERARKDVEERARKDVEERARKDAEERARKDAEEKARKQKIEGWELDLEKWLKAFKDCEQLRAQAQKNVNEAIDNSASKAECEQRLVQKLKDAGCEGSLKPTTCLESLGVSGEEYLYWYEQLLRCPEYADHAQGVIDEVCSNSSSKAEFEERMRHLLSLCGNEIPTPPCEEKLGLDNPIDRMRISDILGLLSNPEEQAKCNAEACMENTKSGFFRALEDAVKTLYVAKEIPDCFVDRRIKLADAVSLKNKLDYLGGKDCINQGLCSEKDQVLIAIKILNCAYDKVDCRGIGKKKPVSEVSQRIIESDNPIAQLRDEIGAICRNEKIPGPTLDCLQRLGLSQQEIQILTTALQNCLPESWMKCLDIACQYENRNAYSLGVIDCVLSKYGVSRGAIQRIQSRGEEPFALLLNVIRQINRLRDLGCDRNSIRSIIENNPMPWNAGLDDCFGGPIATRGCEVKATFLYYAGSGNKKLEALNKKHPFLSMVRNLKEETIVKEVGERVYEPTDEGNFRVETELKIIETFDWSLRLKGEETKDKLYNFNLTAPEEQLAFVQVKEWRIVDNDGNIIHQKETDSRKIEFDFSNVDRGFYAAILILETRRIVESEECKNEVISTQKLILSSPIINVAN